MNMPIQNRPVRALITTVLILSPGTAVGEEMRFEVELFKFLTPLCRSQSQA